MFFLGLSFLLFLCLAVSRHWEIKHLISNIKLENLCLQCIFVVCRNTVSKVYPAMYIENVTELAFDDITPEDPDFSSIQGENST